MKIILLLLILITGLVSWGQDYSQNLKVFTPENKDDSIHVFTFKLPDDAYHINVTINPNVVPDAMYVKYGNEEFWSGFVGEDWNESFLQRDLSLEEKRKILSIQTNDVRNSIENKINYTKPDSSRIQGGGVGEVYSVKNDRGRVVMYIKKVDDTHYRFRGKKGKVIFDSPRSGGIGKVKYFYPWIEPWIFRSINLDPSMNKIVGCRGINTKRLDFGKFTSSNIGPSSFYYDYYRDMDPLPRNFNGELLLHSVENNLLDLVNSKILSNGGSEVSTLFTTTEEKTIEVTSSIIEGSGNLDDYKKNDCGASSGTRSFKFSKKEGVSEITIIIFSPLKTSDDLFELSINQSPEGLNYTYYDSGQLKEKYTLQKGEYHGEYLSYCENTSFNPSMNKDNNPWEGKIKTVYTYVNGQKTGVHKEYDKYENLVLEEELKDGVRNGSYKRYENGKIKEEGTYLDDKKNGEWKLYSYNGIEIYNYSNGIKEGEYKKYTGDVLLQEGQYSIGMKTGTWKDYKSGDLTKEYNFIKDTLDGPYKEYSGNVVVKQGQYTNGLKTGNWKDYNNQSVLTKDYIFIDDKLDGPYKEYSGDIVVKQGQYTNGLMTGKWVFRYPNGNKKAEGEYVNGNGTDNGIKGSSISSPGIPKNGRDGVWTIHHDNGSEYEMAIWLEGKVLALGYALFDRNGVKIRNAYIYEDYKPASEEYSSVSKVLAKGHCNKDPFYKNGHVHDTDISLKCGNCDSRIYEKCCNVGDPRDKNQEKEFTCNSCGAINIVKFSILRTLRRGDNF